MSSRLRFFVARNNRFKRFGFLRLLPAWALLLVIFPAHPAPDVVVSVSPVHSLVSAVMRDVGEARLLLRAGQSPHGHQLTPSQVRSLNAADLIVWVGPLLEPSLKKTIAARGGAGRVVTLLENDQIALLPTRRGGVWGEHVHGEHDGHDEHEEHGEHDEHEEHGNHDEHDGHGKHDEHSEHAEHGEHDHDKHDHDAGHSDELPSDWHADPHLWLSVDNAREIVRIVAHELARIDPANRDRYEANSQALLSRMEQLRHSLRKHLREVADSRYVVFHDAYQYFEQEFGLHPAGALTVSPERPPGAKRIRKIRETIRSRNVRCVFSEPQFPPALIHTLVADTKAATGVLDPLGASLQAGPDAWFELMRGIADSLVDCLSKPPA